MKKIIVFVLCLLAVIIPHFSTEAKVSEQNDDFLEIYQETIYLENGNYLVKRINEVDNTISTRGTAYYKTGELEVAEYNKNDKLLWTYTLVGTYLIETGISCVSTNATYSTEIFSSVWNFSDGSTSFADNYVRGLGTFKHKILLVTTQTIDIDVKLYCDTYGNLY